MYGGSADFPSMSKGIFREVMVSAVQICPRLLSKSDNLEKTLRMVETAARNGARLIALPELTLTGYIFNSLAEAMPVAETVPGPSTEELAHKCAELDVYTVIGLLERDADSVYNTAVLLGPKGIIGKYRKTHLPYCGVDRFVSKGDIEYTVYDTEVGRVGMQICYDLQHPEGSRVLTLKGVQILVNIANWPTGVEFMPDFVIPTRVIENRIHLLACDRVGLERGTRFIGSSMIIDADSKPLVRASKDEEEIIYAKLEPGKASQKRVVITPGENEIDIFADRRPELYGAICDKV